MNRTSWPVLAEIQKMFGLAILAILTSLPFSNLKAEQENLTVVQQVEELPPYTVIIDGPIKTKLNEMTRFTILAKHRLNKEETYLEKLSLVLVITTPNGKTSKKLNFKKGVAVLDEAFDQPYTYHLVVRHSADEADRRRALASTAITVWP